jgi:hypothetical protein
MSERLRRFHGVLMRPFAEQEDRDGNRVDPRALQFDPDAAYPVTMNFDNSQILGRAKVALTEDGALVMDGDLFRSKGEPLKAAVGIYLDDYTTTKDGIRRVRAGRLMGIGLTTEHEDPNQPDIIYDEAL